MSGWAPLAGMSVVEACQRLVGPLAAWQLSMLGAEVTKVEPPAGDIARGWGAVFDLMNAYKRCAVVDLAEPAGRAVFERLCAAADIVLADATWSEQSAIAGIGRAGARTRVVVIIDDGAVPGGCGSSETLAQAALAITPYIGAQGGPPERLPAQGGPPPDRATAVQTGLAGLVVGDCGP